MSESNAGLPARPSLEQLRKRAKELLRAARAGNSPAADRFAHKARIRGRPTRRRPACHCARGTASCGGPNSFTTSTTSS
jgi:hypothetical protein